MASGTKMIAIAALIAVVATVTSAGIEATKSNTLLKGTFVFGDYVLDLNRNVERWHPQYTFAVVNCSNEKYFCLKAETTDSLAIMNVVWPKECYPINVGETWNVGGVTTKVQGKREPLPIIMQDLHNSVTEDKYYFIATDKRNILYEYIPHSGITAILINNSGFSDTLNIEEISKAKKLPLITFDKLGDCAP